MTQGFQSVIDNESFHRDAGSPAITAETNPLQKGMKERALWRSVDRHDKDTSRRIYLPAAQRSAVRVKIGSLSQDNRAGIRNPRVFLSYSSPLGKLDRRVRVAVSLYSTMVAQSLRVTAFP